MSGEPDTRPFTHAELAHFLEQFELDRPVVHSAVIAARAPRIGAEPRTMLGMGGLPSSSLRGGAEDTARARPRAPDPRAPARPRGSRPLAGALGAAPRVSASGPRPSAPPSTAADSSPTGSAWRRALLAEHRPRSLLGEAGARLRLVCAASIATAVFVAAIWGAVTVARPRSAPSAVPAQRRSFRGPPPLPPVSAPPTRIASGRAPAPSAPPTSTSTLRAGESIALPALAMPSARRDAASNTSRPHSQQEPSPVHRAPPLGRMAARREAVDLLLAGHTRAALAPYRELPLTLRAEPALTQLIRLLERELRACDGPARIACGT